MKRFPIFIGLVVFLLLFSAFSFAAPKDTVVIAQGVDATTLDPHMHQETPTYNVCMNIYDGLVRRNTKEEIVPNLAVSWKILNDTTWQFKLREGVKFHNGEEFDANAVKFSIERVINPKTHSPQISDLSAIDHVDVIDKYTVNIVTKKPYPILLARLCNHMIIPPKYTQEKGADYLALHPVGTGPYKFKKWYKDEKIELVANKDYHFGEPKVKKLIFRPIPEASSRIAELLTGGVDIITNVPPDKIKEIEKSKNARVSGAPSARVIFVVLDMTRESPLKSKKVRQALNYAVDVDSIIKYVLNGNGYRVATPLTPAHFGYDPTIKPYPYDPKKAKELLKEAGYPHGFKMTLLSPSGRYLMDKDVAQAIAGQLNKVGLKINVKVLEWGVYVKQILSRKTESPMFLLGWGNDTFDADGTLFPMFRSGERLSFYENHEFDKYVDLARSTLDPEKRKEYYSKALRILYDDPGWIFLYQQKDLYGASKRIKWEARPDERIFGIDVDWNK